MSKDLCKTPNFFIIGAAKAGTTSLSHYLASHPDIFISPIKEPHYFARHEIDIKLMRPKVRKHIERMNIDKILDGDEIIKMHNYYFTEESQYHKLFRETGDASIIGECSTSYMWSETAAKEIYNYNPNAKILAVLRNPVDRAYSHYLMEKRLFSKTSSFKDALTMDKQLGKRKWEEYPMYYELGNYCTQLKRYYDLFPQDQIKVVIYDDFKKHRERTVYSIFDFLNVSDEIDVDLSKEYNKGSVPRNKIAGWALKSNGLKKRLRNTLNPDTMELIKKLVYTPAYKDEIPEEQQRELFEYYKSEVESLQALINRDLGQWLEAEIFFSN